MDTEMCYKVDITNIGIVIVYLLAMHTLHHRIALEEITYNIRLINGWNKQISVNAPFDINPNPFNTVNTEITSSKREGVGGVQVKWLRGKRQKWFIRMMLTTLHFKWQLCDNEAIAKLLCIV